MLETALINILGVATWYLLGLAYVSTASRYWPYKESMRGKWLPRDVAELIYTDPEYASIRQLPPHLMPLVVNLAFLMMLTIWPVTVYRHAKRKFSTQPDKPAK